MIQTVFKRVEKKYLLTENQYQELLKSCKNYIKEDEFGLHTVCNIYYDTNNYELVRKSIEKPAYKEKVRLRSYDTPNGDTKVYLELKKKYDGIVYKRRITMPLSEAMECLENKKINKSDQISKEINYVLNYYDLEPKLYLAYDRKAYYGKESDDLRITFDTNIRSRMEDIDLSLGDAGELLFDKKYYLMEVKTASAMPMWFVKVLDSLNIYPTSFSKYGSIYQKLLKKGKILYV